VPNVAHTFDVWYLQRLLLEILPLSIAAKELKKSACINFGEVTEQENTGSFRVTVPMS